MNEHFPARRKIGFCAHLTRPSQVLAVGDAERVSLALAPKSAFLSEHNKCTIGLGIEGTTIRSMMIGYPTLIWNFFPSIIKLLHNYVLLVLLKHFCSNFCTEARVFERAQQVHHRAGARGHSHPFDDARVPQKALRGGIPGK